MTECIGTVSELENMSVAMLGGIPSTACVCVGYIAITTLIIYIYTTEK